MTGALSYKTAISRTKPSAPMMWLSNNNLLRGRCLDFGCGRGFDVDYFNIEGYDPHYRPEFPKGSFDTITCIYVLNTLPLEAERQQVIKSVLSLLSPGGVAYLVIRRDVKKKGLTSKGTYQENIELDLPVIRKTSAFIIYILTKQ